MSLVGEWIQRARARAILVMAGYVGPDVALRAELRGILGNAYRAGRIRTIYDIGAHKGRWATSMRRLMPEARFVLFEANPLHQRDLVASGFEHYISVLSYPGASEVAFYSMPDDVGSTGGSIYKEKTPQYVNVEAVRLPADSLSTIVAKHNLPGPDFVKMDAQGAEMDVLAGGREVIAEANYVLIELPVIEYNSGAPTLDVYLATLKELGFLPVAVPEIHRYGPLVIQLALIGE